MRVHTLAEIHKKSLGILTLYSDVRTITFDSPLYYNNQIPHVACFVISGKLEIVTSSKRKKFITEGNLIGVRELMNNSTANVTVNLIRGTQIAFLDRSSIKNIINGRHENLASFFKSILI
jgi:signal-transduction protein with cAMP-binding, CBS, and nucleotidyltransferase domain